MADNMSDNFIPSSRRRILQVLFGGTLAVIAAPVLYVVTKFILPLPGQIVSAVAGNARDISAGDPRVIKLGMKDVMVMRAQDGSFMALDLKCTHAGCIVKWQPDQKLFKCPCHGGEYDASGKVVKGPPPRPLNKLQISVNNHGDIIVTDLPAANV